MRRDRVARDMGGKPLPPAALRLRQPLVPWRVAWEPISHQFRDGAARGDWRCD